MNSASKSRMVDDMRRLALNNSSAVANRGWRPYFVVTFRQYHPARILEGEVGHVSGCPTIYSHTATTNGGGGGATSIFLRGSREYYDAFPKRWDISYFAIHVGVPPAPRPCPRPSKIPSIASRHHVERDAHEVLAARPLDEILPVLMGTNALIPIPSLRPSPLVQEYGIPAQEGTRLAAYP
jgi:hypothetical protein